MLIFYNSLNKENSGKMVLLINGEKGGLDIIQKLKFEKGTALKFSVFESTKFKCEFLYSLYKLINQNMNFVNGYMLNVFTLYVLTT